MAARVEVAAMPASHRWRMLAGYSVLAACTQLLWLSFAAVDIQTASALHVDVGTVGDLAIIFPFVYIVLALPTGRWLDMRFTQALSAGAILTGGGALLRLVDPTSFALQVAGMLVIAAGQPLVLNSVTKVAARHFPPSQRAVAISIGTAALFVGILAAVLTAGPLYDAGGLPVLLVAQAVPSVIIAVVVVILLRVTPASYPDDPSVSVSLGWLTRDRFMWTLAALVFVGMGTYNAVATWLQPILDHFGQGAAAGNLIAVLTFAGILGAAVLPSAVAARDLRRTALLAALAVSAVAFAAVALEHNVIWLGAWFFVEGLLLLACLPVILDWSELHAGPERQGAAVGFLMMAGNLGGVVLALITQLAVGNAYLALGLMSVAALAAIPVAMRLPSRARESVA